MADLVEETVAQIRARLSELAPVVSEYERLEAAYAALDDATREGAGGPRRADAGASERARRSAGAERGRRGSGVRRRGPSEARTRRRCLP